VAWGEVPEGVAATIGIILGADSLASHGAHWCEHCRRANTLRIVQAEHAVLQAIRDAYAPDRQRKAAPVKSAA
jgi:hypothetical protein